MSLLMDLDILFLSSATLPKTCSIALSFPLFVSFFGVDSLVPTSRFSVFLADSFFFLGDLDVGLGMAGCYDKG